MWSRRSPQVVFVTILNSFRARQHRRSRCLCSACLIWIKQLVAFVIVSCSQNALWPPMSYLQANFCCEGTVSCDYTIGSSLLCSDYSAESFSSRQTSEIHSRCTHRAVYHTTRAENRQRIDIGRPLSRKHCRNKATVLFGSCLRHWFSSSLVAPWKILSNCSWPVSPHSGKAILPRKVTHSLWVSAVWLRLRILLGLTLFVFSVRIYGLGFSFIKYRRTNTPIYYR